ncbi:MAG: hypothetical protein KDK69_03175, partial [Chlamydiia bacterium]|nr:hypothetical protein [Chlamydiia bacterium]
MASTVAFTAFDVLKSIQEHGIVPSESHANRIAGSNDSYIEGLVWCNYFGRNIPYDTRPSGEDVQKLASIASTITSYQLHSLVYHSSG